MNTRKPSKPVFPQRQLRTLAAALGVAWVATLASTALAQPAGGPGPGLYADHNMGMGMDMGAGRGMGTMDPGGPGMGRHGPQGHHGHPGGQQAMNGGRQLQRMFERVRATPEQRAKIQAIADNARTDMQVQREAGRNLREQSRALFAQPTIDANAAEALRQQMLVQHDQASRRMLQTRLDIAAVLTPEQRKAWADRVADRKAMREHHRAAGGSAPGR